MWFLRRRRSKEDQDEATAALQDAKENLKKIERRGKEVTQISEALREIRERNHFAEQMEAIILQRGKGG